MSITNAIRDLASVDLFKEAKKDEYFVGRPFYLDYQKAFVLIADAWKDRVKGVPHGSFLLAFYESSDKEAPEAVLLRALNPAKLPTDSSITSSMIEYYKEDLNTAGESNQLDSFTRYEFSFSGLECRVLGTFYKDTNGSLIFGSDLENFYSAHNYSVYKPTGKVLEVIANLRDEQILGQETDEQVGVVRYSSSQRFQQEQTKVPVYISPKDFLGKRTALFGMTRTGKSNTIKKIIDATVKISNKSSYTLEQSHADTDYKNPLTDTGYPKYPIGQIIFDINGEYANPNPQDEGSAISEKYSDLTVRYSVIEKKNFEVMRVNFYSEKEVASGFSLISDYFKKLGDIPDYINNFLVTSLEKPDDYLQDRSVKTRFDRLIAAYYCVLRRAGFEVPHGFQVKFEGNAKLNNLVREENVIDPSKGISLDDAVLWFSRIWELQSDEFFTEYQSKHGKPWVDDSLRSMLIMLTRTKKGSTPATISGYYKLSPIKKFHTATSQSPFEVRIVEELRAGKIVIVDLSQGDPEIQELYSERICQRIFFSSMDRFIENQPNNFIQFYFEEAHNLFPKKDSNNLKQIYNKIAKEGAKLNLGMLYATQEVSSVSSNILKNTQNWFVAHLNNEDELKEVKKFYDFGDFVDGLVRFSAKDQGFVRMKTYSNPFVVPVQIDRFSAL